MENKQRKLRNILAIILLITLTVGFAILTTTLVINGRARMGASNWDIHFANLSPTNIVGEAIEESKPIINNNDTVIDQFYITLKQKGDLISYTFDVVNAGEINAEISSFMKMPPTCVGTGTSATADENIVCNSLVFELKYTNSGERITIGDTLDAGETKSLTLTIEYPLTASSVPISEVDVSDLAFSIVYVQATGTGTGQTGGGGTIGIDAIIAPDLVNGMIPIKWNGSNWVKADYTNASNDWFDYNTGKWANVVLVSASNRAIYQNATIGTTIPESEILAYYVWIPRYRYKIFNDNNNGTTTSQIREVEIKFEGTNKTKSTGTNNGDWLTHPAFTFGTTEINGFWVGKFENSADTTSTCYTTPTIVNCDLSTVMPRIKPSVDSWRYISVSNMVATNKLYQSNSLYGISSSNLDAHMMKNNEWGAVAYLSQSKYGKYGNSDFSGANKEIYINNVQKNTTTYATQTGCSSGSTDSAFSTSCSSVYSIQGTGTGASTTGTIYGIYDMNGGAYEYVMGNMKDAAGLYQPSSSGLAVEPSSVYMDIYDYSTFTNDYVRGHLGDASKEVISDISTYKSWHNDVIYMPSSTSSWIYRGGYVTNSASSGIFYMNRGNGIASQTQTSRSVLSKK